MLSVNPFGVLQDFLAKTFYSLVEATAARYRTFIFSYGLYVSRNPNPFIIGPLLVTFCLMFGVLNVRVAVSLLLTFH